jgi:hypothetical protein
MAGHNLRFLLSLFLGRLNRYLDYWSNRLVAIAQADLAGAATIGFHDIVIALFVPALATVRAHEVPFRARRVHDGVQNFIFASLRPGAEDNFRSINTC